MGDTRVSECLPEFRLCFILNYFQPREDKRSCWLTSCFGSALAVTLIASVAASIPTRGTAPDVFLSALYEETTRLVDSNRAQPLPDPLSLS